jgi:hypothetical protein
VKIVKLFMFHLVQSHIIGSRRNSMMIKKNSL